MQAETKVSQFERNFHIYFPNKSFCISMRIYVQVIQLIMQVIQVIQIIALIQIISLYEHSLLTHINFIYARLFDSDHHYHASMLPI